MTWYVIIVLAIVGMFAWGIYGENCSNRTCASPTAKTSIVRTTAGIYECVCLERPR